MRRIVLLTSLSGIGILSRIFEILLCQPSFFFQSFWNVDAFDLEDDRPRAVVAAGNHHAVIIGPALHDRSALKRSIDISADGVPRLAAELSVHQVIEIILFRCALEYKGIARMEERVLEVRWTSV